MKSTQQAPMRGWVKAPRNLLAHPVSHNPRLFSLYITLMLMQPYDGNRIATSGRQLSQQTGIDRHSLASMMATLQGYGLLSFSIAADGYTITVGSCAPATGAPAPAVGGFGTAVGSCAPAHSSLYNKEKKEENIYNNSSSVLTASPEEFMAEMRKIFRQREEKYRSMQLVMNAESH